jgi:hypothetical protein
VINDRAYTGYDTGSPGTLWPGGRTGTPKTNRNGLGAAANILLALIGLLISAGSAVTQSTSDWITGLNRAPIHVLV